MVDFPEELKNHLDADGRLNAWPRKYTRKIVAAHYLAARFAPGQVYSEAQVNAILEDWHTFNDAAVIRRFMVDLGIMQREKDGRRYWLAEPPANPDTA